MFVPGPYLYWLTLFHHDSWTAEAGVGFFLLSREAGYLQPPRAPACASTPVEKVSFHGPPPYTKGVLNQFCLKYWFQLVPTTLHTSDLLVNVSLYSSLLSCTHSLLFVHRFIRPSCRYSFSAYYVSALFSAVEYKKKSMPYTLKNIKLEREKVC